MTTKYTDKRVIHVNENLRIVQYFYRSGVAIYFQPKSADEEVIKVWVSYPDLEKEADKLIAERMKMLADAQRNYR